MYEYSSPIRSSLIALIASFLLCYHTLLCAPAMWLGNSWLFADHRPQTAADSRRPHGRSDLWSDTLICKHTETVMRS